MNDEKLIIEGVTPGGSIPGGHGFKITLDIDNFVFLEDDNGWHYTFSYEISGQLADFTKKNHGYAKIYKVEEDSNYTANHCTHGMFIANFISQDLPSWRAFASEYTLINRLAICLRERGIDAKNLTLGDCRERDAVYQYVDFYYFLQGDAVRYIAVLKKSGLSQNLKFKVLTTNDVVDLLCYKEINESEYTFIP